MPNVYAYAVYGIMVPGTAGVQNQSPSGPLPVSKGAHSLTNLKTTKFLSNVLDAISKLKLKNSKKSLFYSSLILASLQLYRHMKLHSKQPVKQAAL